MRLLTATFNDGSVKTYDTAQFTTSEPFDTGGNLVTVFHVHYNDLHDGLWMTVYYYDVSSDTRKEDRDNSIGIANSGFDIQLLDREDMQILVLFKEDNSPMLFRCGDVLINGPIFEATSNLYLSEQSDLSFQEKAVELFETLLKVVPKLDHETQWDYEGRLASMAGWGDNPEELKLIVERIQAEKEAISEISDSLYGLEDSDFLE